MYMYLTFSLEVFKSFTQYRLLYVCLSLTDFYFSLHLSLFRHSLPWYS